MRWLKKYPITEEEVMKTLESMPEDHPDAIGGVNDFIRNRIIQHFKNPENMQKILEELKI